jgi:hypothetical protein
MKTRWMLAAALAALVAGCGTQSTPSHPAATHAAATAGTQQSSAPASSASACDPATSTTACPIAKIHLNSPTSSSTFGIAEILKKGKTTAIAVVGQGLAPNTSHNAYALWLYNSASDAVRLGFVNPGIGRNGRLATAGGLPPNAARYRELVVTLETEVSPRTPGPIVLEGRFAE